MISKAKACSSRFVAWKATNSCRRTIFAARKRAMTRLRRVTVVGPEDLEQEMCRKFVELGATGYTSIPCYGAGRETLPSGGRAR